MVLFSLEQINLTEAVICILASQIANLGESVIGALFQDKEGFQWVSIQLILSMLFVLSLGSYVSETCYSFVAVDLVFFTRVCFPHSGTLSLHFSWFFMDLIMNSLVTLPGLVFPYCFFF